MQPSFKLSLSTTRYRGAWDIQGSRSVPGRKKVVVTVTEMRVLPRSLQARQTLNAGQSGTVSCPLYPGCLSSDKLPHDTTFWYLPVYLQLLDVLVLHPNWFSRNIFGSFFFFFPSCSWVGKTHICIEIILSELSLQRCQIYKHHYCKDMVLDMDSSSTPHPPTANLSLFLPSFIMSGSPHIAFISLGFCFWAIYLPRWYFCVLKHITIFYFGLFYYTFHHNFKIKQSYSKVLQSVSLVKARHVVKPCASCPSLTPMVHNLSFEDAGL